MELHLLGCQQQSVGCSISSCVFSPWLPVPSLLDPLLPHVNAILLLFMPLLKRQSQTRRHLILLVRRRRRQWRQRGGGW
jgi:hypothetical protein